MECSAGRENELLSVCRSPVLFPSLFVVSSCVPTANISLSFLVHSMSLVAVDQAVLRRLRSSSRHPPAKRAREAGSGISTPSVPTR